jgi:RNA polymerase sigma-32 factor
VRVGLSAEGMFVTGAGRARASLGGLPRPLDVRATHRALSILRSSLSRYLVEVEAKGRARRALPTDARTCYAWPDSSIRTRTPLPRTTSPNGKSPKKERPATPKSGAKASESAARPRPQPARRDAANRTDEGGDDPETEEGRSGDDEESDARDDGDGDLEPAAELGESVAEDDVRVPAVAAKATNSGPIERFDALSAYLREVQRHPLLPPEETHTLAVRFIETQDPDIAARLVTANLRLVVKIAYEYRRAYKNIMDLIQEGNIGLMQAVKRYDPYRGVKLSSYAAWWIRAYILRFILNNWRLVKLGTTQAQRKLFFNLRKKRAELQALGIEPTDAEVAKQLDVAESEVTDMEARLQASEKSLDAPIGDGDGRSTAKIDTMASAVEGPEALLAGSELQGLLEEKLSAFRKTLVGKEKDLAIFDSRLVSDEPLTLQELGDRFNISRERVRQLEQRLTGRLRDYLRQEMGDAVELA